MTISWELRKILGKFCELIGDKDRAGVDLLLGDLYKKYDLSEYDKLPENSQNRIVAYFKEKVIPHKVAVFDAGRSLHQNEWFASFVDSDSWSIQLLYHDLSKFAPVEALAYSVHDFKSSEPDLNFELAWHHHKINNPHHPEYWLSPQRGGKTVAFPMPPIYIAEMVADWIGAGKTYGTPLEEWLPGNLHNFYFHPETRELLMDLLTRIGVKVVRDGNSENVLIALNDADKLPI